MRTPQSKFSCSHRRFSRAFQWPKEQSSETIPIPRAVFFCCPVFEKSRSTTWRASVGCSSLRGGALQRLYFRNRQKVKIILDTFFTSGPEPAGCLALEHHDGRVGRFFGGRRGKQREETTKEKRSIHSYVTSARHETLKIRETTAVIPASFVGGGIGSPSNVWNPDRRVTSRISVSFRAHRSFREISYARISFARVLSCI